MQEKHWKLTPHAAAVTRLSVAGPLGGHFGAGCCFQVIYFNPNIFFVPPSETRVEAGLETIRLMRTLKNA